MTKVARKIVTEGEWSMLAGTVALFICAHNDDAECDCPERADQIVLSIALKHGCAPVTMESDEVIAAVAKENGITISQGAAETAQHLMDRAQSDMRANKEGKDARMSGESKMPDEQNKD